MQQVLLMHVTYRVQLPDHDFPAASGLKLTPSVYAQCNVNSFDGVSYNGPTFIKVRSAKHTQSCAANHFSDLMEMMETFSSTTKTDGQVKPIAIFCVDNGPSVSPKSIKVLREAMQYFKRFDLDAVFICSYPPKNSAFNIAERRMPKLSYALAGVLLKHDHYGSHLDASGRTIDAELERKNFEKAGELCCELWNKIEIAKEKVVAVYDTKQLAKKPARMNYKWANEHVRQSTYCIQIVRCNNR